MGELVPVERIEGKIYFIRGQKVMLDRDLAKLYGVKTKALNQGVRRNINRFPLDFMFRLTPEEAGCLSRSQFVTLKRGKNIKYFPYVFTQEGIAMLSGVLKSKRAIKVNIQIMRVFVRLREILSNHKDIALKLDKLERRVGDHDYQIEGIFEAIRKLMKAPSKKKRRIGFLR